MNNKATLTANKNTSSGSKLSFVSPGSPSSAADSLVELLNLLQHRACWGHQPVLLRLQVLPCSLTLVSSVAPGLSPHSLGPALVVLLKLVASPVLWIRRSARPGARGQPGSAPTRGTQLRLWPARH